MGTQSRSLIGVNRGVNRSSPDAYSWTSHRLHFLGEKVCSLKEQRNEIIAALDFLFTGF